MDNSFPKSGRLRKRSDFLAVQRAGKTQHGRYFVVVSEKNGRGRLGITVSKKVGNAVVRNRVKRLVREFVRCAAPVVHDSTASPQPKLSPSWIPDFADVVVIARKNAAQASASQLWADLTRCGAGLKSELSS